MVIQLKINNSIKVHWPATVETDVKEPVFGPNNAQELTNCKSLIKLKFKTKN